MPTIHTKIHDDEIQSELDDFIEEMEESRIEAWEEEFENEEGLLEAWASAFDDVYCQNCGDLIEDGVEECIHCGYNFNNLHRFSKLHSELYWLLNEDYPI